MKKIPYGKKNVIFALDNEDGECKKMGMSEDRSLGSAEGEFGDMSTRSVSQ